MKLGILVVYLVAEDDAWVLEAHLRHLTETRCSMAITIYAAVNRLPERYRQVLASHPCIEMVVLPTVPLRMSAEQGTYLDMLAARAARDGCSYLCTFDVDSWPIFADWPERVLRLLDQTNAPLAAVLRAENGDTVLPHPSFTFFEAGLLGRSGFLFWPPLEQMTPARMWLEGVGQRIDTGCGLAHVLQRDGISWVKLLRSNKVDYHYMMAGIYGDLIFHLGASSRKKLFARDGATWASRLTAPLASLPWVWRHKEALVDRLEALVEPPVYRRNQATYDEITRRLRRDETEFYRELLQDEKFSLQSRS